MKHTRCIFGLLLLCLCLSTGLGAQTLREEQNKKERLQQDIQILNGQLADIGKRSNSADTQLRLLRSRMEARRELLRESERELRVAQDSMYANQKRINRLQERLDTLTHYSGKLIRSAYKNRDARVWYMYLLASDNVSQALHRFSYLRNLSSKMSTQARHIREARSQLEERQDTLKVWRSKAARVRDERKEEMAKLQREENQALQLSKQLQKDKKKYQKLLAAKQKEVQAINQKIERMIEAETQKGKQSKPVDTKLSKSFADNKGRLPWPASGRIIAHFGQQRHPVYTNVKMPFNNGINIATAAGTPVYAVFDGEVRQIILQAGYNQCVLVQHGSYFTFYCKLQDVSVKVGDKVKTGQLLGHVITLGHENQLHFQLWKGKTVQNPELWLRKP